MQIARMKPRMNPVRPSNRARQFAREIMLATAITIAAVIMFLIAREPTEVAAVNPEPSASETPN